MGWLDSHSIDTALRKMPLVADGTVGDMGEYSVLNDAIDAGWTKIFLGDGAYMDADISISSHSIFIVSFHARRVIDLGNYSITISGHNAHLAGFTLDGTNAGIVISGVCAVVENIRVINSSGDGVQFGAGSGNQKLFNCEIRDNSGDGVHLTGANNITAYGNEIEGNGAYGIYADGSSNNMIVCNDLTNNTTAGTDATGDGVTGNIT